MCSLRHVLLLVRDVPRTARFYADGLGLRVGVLSERWAELHAGRTTIALQAVDGCVRVCVCVSACARPPALATAVRWAQQHSRARTP